MVNAILQGQQQNQKTIEKGKGKSKFNQKRHADKQCVCGLIHLFENCPHLIKAKQPIDWTEIKEKRENIRQKICMRSVNCFRVIRHISNTNILNGLTENSIEKGKNQQESETVAELLQYRFANTAYTLANRANLVGEKRWNSLKDSVIYDFDCDYSLINDKTRFRSELVSENEEKLIDTFDEEMQVVEYEIMMVKKSLHGQIKEMIFSNIAYIFVSKFTLISTNKFKRKRFI